MINKHTYTRSTLSEIIALGYRYADQMDVVITTNKISKKKVLLFKFYQINSILLIQLSGLLGY